MAMLTVKCAGILCGEQYEFVAIVTVNGKDVFTCTRVRTIDSNAPLTLSAPPLAMIQEMGVMHPRAELPFKFWEEATTKRKVTDQTFTVDPPQPEIQRWWVNYG